MTNILRILRGSLPYTLPVLALAACSNVNVSKITDVPLLLTPYRIDVQQGNAVTQDMVSGLKPGMSKEQVKFVMGTPLVTDMFHTNRWDYIYRLQRGKGGVEERKLSVYFENDVLLRVDGDVIAQAAPPAPDKPAQEKGFFARMLEKLGL